MKYKENIDYELIPSSTDDDHWNVRFLTGDYVETVIAYGKISLEGNGVGDGFLDPPVNNCTQPSVVIDLIRDLTSNAR